MQKYHVRAVVRYVGRDNESKQVSGECFMEDTFYAMSHDEGFVLEGAAMAVQNSVRIVIPGENVLTDVQVTAFYITAVWQANMKDQQ